MKKQEYIAPSAECISMATERRVLTLSGEAGMEDLILGEGLWVAPSYTYNL